MNAKDMEQMRRDRFRGAFIGLAVGDALGGPAEFMQRGSYPRLSEMVGGGAFELAPGEWTDDTSMALCMAASLIEKGGFDAKDIMDRFVAWWQGGYMSSRDHCFDIGGTTSQALRRFMATGDPYAGSTDPNSAGNGAIMRLSPVVLYFIAQGVKPAMIMGWAAASSKLTHGSEACIDGARMLAMAIYSGAVEQATHPDTVIDRIDHRNLWQTPEFQALPGWVAGNVRNDNPRGLKSSGYVLDTMQAALWAFASTDSFEDCLVRAVNLGGDTDSIGAVAGQIAGAFYGESAIPERWRSALMHWDILDTVADRLFYRQGGKLEF